MNKDLYVVCKGDKLKAINTVLFNPGYKAIRRYRRAHYYYSRFGWRFVPRFLTYLNQVNFSIDIDYRAKIGEGFQIVHGSAGGVVIGCNCVIGNNVEIHQGVTIGGNGGKEKKTSQGILINQPIIGDRCKIMTGALVLGPIEVGEDSIIGARALVMKDIPKNSIVYSNNGLVINLREIGYMK